MSTHGSRLVVYKYKHLVSALEAAIKSSRRNGRSFNNGASLCEAIEAFLFAVRQDKRLAIEFESRARLIEAACAAGTEFDRLRRKVLEMLTVQPGSELTSTAAKSLAYGNPAPTHQLELQEIRRHLRRLDTEIAPERRDPLRQLSRLVNGLLKTAMHVQPDGCRYLSLVADGAELDASEEAIVLVRDPVKHGQSLAAMYLQPMADAAKLLMAGAPEEKDSADLIAFRPAKEFVGQHGIDTHVKLTRFLKAHGEIRTLKPTQRRLLVHAGDWQAHWSRHDEAQSDLLDVASIEEAAREQAKRQEVIRRGKQRKGQPRPNR